MGNRIFYLVKYADNNGGNIIVAILFLLILSLIWSFISLMNKRTNEKYKVMKCEFETIIQKNENIDVVTINLRSGSVASKKNFELLYDNSNGIASMYNFLDAISLERDEFNRIVHGSSIDGYFEFEYSVKKEDEDRFIRAYSHKVNDKKVDLILCDITKERVGNITYVRDDGIDQVTGLINKNNYKEEIKKHLDEYRFAYGIFLFIEVNDFEDNHNLYGSEFAESIIQIVSAKLKGYVDKSTAAFKFNGAHFGLYKHGFNKREDMNSFLNNIKEKLTSAKVINNITVNLSCTIGTAILNFDVTSEEELYNYAEFAMKEGRKNRVGFKSTINHFDKKEFEKYKKVNKKLNRVLKVIEDRKYYSVFQPIICLDDMSLYGVEGLTRIQDRNYRSIIDFLDIARLKNLEDYVSMKFGINIYHDYIVSPIGKNVKIFINETFNEERSRDRQKYFETVKKELMERNVDIDTSLMYENVVVEFSERSTYDVASKVSEIVSLYRENNALIAIDDFGAGHANEGLILKMKPDIVKLDRELISNIDKDDYTRTLTTNTIKTLKNLGVKIVAEGIETKEEFDFLRSLGVEYGQGYYIQKPTSIDEIRLDYSDIL
ncbi:MAG: EAL domain-containing protein [Clostridium sp.]|uniref:EAL domain-containing protein n=1 Tax=Clostridium sp. TaxID=1506 RepID=UPI002FCAC164